MTGTNDDDTNRTIETVQNTKQQEFVTKLKIEPFLGDGTGNVKTFIKDLDTG